MSLKMDGGREVQLDPRQHPHLDHGYVVTSHSSQGQTADRVLIHVDTELGAKTCSTAAWPMSPSRAALRTRSSLPTTVRNCRRSGTTFPPERPCAGGEAGAGYHAAAAGDRAGKRSAV